MQKYDDSDVFDERLLDCSFCGTKFYGLPDMHLFGWDDNSPMFICPSCEDAQQCLPADAGESAALEGESTPEVLSTSQADSQPAPRW